MAVGLAAITATAALGIGGITIAGAQAPATSSAISLGVGANASQRVVSWYTSANTAQSVQVAPTASLTDGAFPASATTFAATVAANTVNGGFNGHAILSGLQEDTAYSYRVGSEGSWSATYTFKTQKFKGEFDFLFYGDPQIGSSGNVPKDGAGWEDTLNVSLAANPNAELLVSGGDQVETANTESQWDAFLKSDKLRQYPWAATIGNHDVGGKAYDQHFWTPNTDRSADYYSGSTSTQSGGDYYYVYKDVLFIHLNSNAYAGTKDAAHVKYVTDTVNAHGSEAKYTVLVFHHAIYSPASHANDGDNKQRRQDFPTAFSNLGVDLVLAGHDHSYSRSYALKNGQKANASEQPGAAQVVTGPGGVIYVTGNSASGSKYYDITKPVAGEFGPDPLNPNSHYANSVENQEHVRTYVRVQVRNDKLVVENVRSGTCAAPNSAVENGSWCGPNGGASPAQPVGSIVDKVTIHAAEANTDAPVGGTVPATLSLTLGTPATFGAFTPGLEKEYSAATDATVISTAGDAALTVSDPGHLTNGAFSLPEPLQVAFSKSAWAAPVSNDKVDVSFKQLVKSTDALRTGAYTKSLTFTLSTTNP
ncbi:metallophosphoesterase family protein [Solirubrobacter phytolaccae]|uniref:Metallophosphoesterase family protein n=1 Tax=Solirubrobacter phytolaccae TaxID=1404360 RepID=A0A9X3S922_9ACTN|nr:metallophosphoesterase family protein [Solirubrobacter phytolaccae]MDA0182223.1 metallophosphoesterase family protein [Solirubrobacter phytolaccae]